MNTPPHCLECPTMFSIMGACPNPDTYFIYSLISIVPYTIIFIIIALFLITRKLKHFYLTILLVTIYVFGDRLLKNLLMSPRPQGSCKKSYGLPSSHMSVIVAYAFATINQYTNYRVAILMIILCVLQGISRVQLKYHTWNQVIVGVIFGIVYSHLFTKLFYIIYKPLNNLFKNKWFWVIKNDIQQITKKQ